jgi:hypothetical protein
MTYLVRESFQAVIRRDASSIAYITIMPGSLLTVLGDAEQSGTVRVSYMDRIAAAFMRDIGCFKVRWCAGKSPRLISNIITLTMLASRRLAVR